jgi:hypothetical protein
VARSPFRRQRGGGYRVDLGTNERRLLAGLAEELRRYLTEESPASDSNLQPLFPPAYPDDLLMNLDYERGAGDAVLSGRLRALEVLERTADATTLTEGEVDAWMRSINDIRLVLGTRIGVTEDEPSPAGVTDPGELAAWHTNGVLSMMLELIVQARGEPDA